jgi:hypothetical protein
MAAMAIVETRVVMFQASQGRLWAFGAVVAEFGISESGELSISGGFSPCDIKLDRCLLYCEWVQIFHVQVEN